MPSRPKLRRVDTTDSEEGVLEPQVEIRLTSRSAQPENEVRYDFRSGQYQRLPDGDYLIHLLTLPSTVIHKEELELLELEKAKVEAAANAKKQEQQQEQQQRRHLFLLRQPQEQQEEQQEQQQEQEQQPQDVSQELEELYGNIMTPEQLAKLDSQPNPFNFSERVSQTLRIPRKDLKLQTDQPPSNTFSSTVGLSNIYDAYERDYCLVLARERQQQLEKEKQEERDKKAGKKPEEKKEPSSKFQKDGKGSQKKQVSPEREQLSAMFSFCSSLLHHPRCNIMHTSSPPHQ